MARLKTVLRHSIHKRYVKIFLLAVCCIGAVTGLDVAVYNVTVKSPSRPLKSNITNSASPTLPAVIGSINTAITTKFPALEKVAGPDTANTNGFPVNGYSYAVLLPYSSQTSLTYSDSNSPNESAAYAVYQSTLSVIENTLSRAGFTLLPQSSADGSLESTLFFQRSNAVCQVTSYSVLDIACDSTSNLTQVATAAQPLISAYTTGYPTLAVQTIAPPLIQPSNTPGYSIASIGIFASNGETKLNLYKLSAGSWQVVNLSWYNDPHQDADIQPNCEDFDSVEQIRMAFNGQACYDSDTKSESSVH